MFQIKSEAKMFRQTYSIDFEDPPGFIRSSFHLTLWWTNPVVRKVMMTTPWPNRIRQGEYQTYGNPSQRRRRNKRV